MYLAVLGREPELSVAELEAVFGGAEKVSDRLAVFESKMVLAKRLELLQCCHH